MIFDKDEDGDKKRDGKVRRDYSIKKRVEELGFKSKCRVHCISSAQIGDKEIRDIKPHYYIGIRMNFAIFPI